MKKQSLVDYFSVSGVIKSVAHELAKAIDADLFEIKPAVPYTDEDLNWMNKKARSTIEMKNLSSRPAISKKVENMEQYQTIYLGFPIWWYIAPTIINTFLESYDFTGKIIIPFATSGGSGMGKTNLNLEESCQGALLKEGKVFSRKESQESLRTWANSLL